MLKFIDNFDKKVSLAEFKLIIPAVSVGNVGQLAVDLVISTLNLTRVGYIRHQNISPVVAKCLNGLTTECELYASSDLKIAVVQIRSTYGKFSSISKFFTDLCKSFKCVVILSGSYAYERKNIHLVQEPLYYLATDVFHDVKLPGLPGKWKKLEECDITPKRTKIPGKFFFIIKWEINKKLTCLFFLPGSGIGDHLYDLCAEEGIPALLIVSFVSEGDNRNDAVAMADYLNSWLELKSENFWKVPVVWDTLFGNPIPQNLF